MPDAGLDEETTVLKQLIKLNEKGAKHRELLVQIRDIEKANGIKLDTIHIDKLEQKIGDKVSRWLALIGLSIATATLYLSEGPFAQAIRLWFSQLGVK